ncbi:MAG: MATE family efflux transporter [Solobacterium sp.]|nr:MATE family efflux transporter [Solobacterium sp.]
MAAQIVHLLYNIVDRIFIGHMPGGDGAITLTGIGLCFPIITIIAAFTSLLSYGGAPLFAIARGAGEDERAEKILNQVAFQLLCCSVVIALLSYLFRKPVLYLFGASDQSFPYADDYLQIYLAGTAFSMLSTGLNSFINAQGFPRHGMMTVTVGAVTNLILDPLFIFVFRMGVQGAALATVIAQFVSFFWVMRFFFSDISLFHFRRELRAPDPVLLKEIVSLVVTGFIMQGTNSLVQIACNVMLRMYGGDLYVGIMTVINSIREVMSLPCQALTQGSQPVISYNYGARLYSRIRAAIRFNTAAAGIYTMAAWLIVIFFPRQLMAIFTEDPTMIDAGAKALFIYFFGFVFMTLQFTGQSAFTATRCVKRAVFFSLFRKVIIVVPLTFFLPVYFGTDGVFLAEPISNVIGGLACFITMILTLYRKFPADGEPMPENA